MTRPGTSHRQTRDNPVVRSFVMVDVRPDDFDAGLGLLVDYVRTAESDDDVDEITLCRELDLTNHFVIDRIFPNHQSYVRHNESDYVLAFREKLHPLQGSPWDDRLTHFV